MDFKEKERLESFVTGYFAHYPIEEIKSINRLSPEMEATLASLSPLVAAHIETLIQKFYGFVLNNKRARTYFASEEQIKTLQNINRRSFVRTFTPPFDQTYFAYRLKVGFVHYAIDLSPELYVGAIGVLESALADVWEASIPDPEQRALAREATSRMLKIELQLTLDTYFTLGRQDVDTARRKAQEVLDHLNEGFLTLTPDLNITIASRSCSKLFGTDVSGLNIAKIPGISEENAQFLASGIEQYFENFMPLDINISLLPRRIRSIHERILELRYTPILDAKEQPIKLVITVQDATDAIAKTERLESENQLNKALMHILRHKDAFISFLSDTRQDLEQLSCSSEEAVAKRLLHTLKGNSAAFGLGGLAHLVHETESKADVEIAKHGLPSFCQAAAREIGESLDAFLKYEGAVLGLETGVVQSKEFTINEAELEQLGSLAASLQSKGERVWLENFIKGLKLRSAHSFTSTFPSLVSRLGEKLGKKVELKVEGGETKVDPEAFTPIFKQLVHAIRNAVDHGIELPEERLEAGKHETAQIKISVVATAAGDIELVVLDDGRGINKDRLLAKAREKNLVSDSWLKAALPADVFALIFADGLSTAATISDTSGRGVGMSALKAEVEAVGGEIDVWSEQGQYTRLRIRVKAGEKGNSNGRRPASKIA